MGGPREGQEPEEAKTVVPEDTTVTDQQAVVEGDNAETATPVAEETDTKG